MSRGGDLHHCPNCGKIMLVSTLTVTEIEVLRSFWEGKGVKEIAKERFVSVKTVESHRRTLYLKAGLDGHKNIVALCRWGLEKGYLQDED